jgi:transcription elongation factor Elf1
MNDTTCDTHCATKGCLLKRTLGGGFTESVRHESAPSPGPSLACALACRNNMGGKAKPTKHTTAEINKKVAEATQNRGGGAAGLADRKGGAAGHSKFKCPTCGQAAPDLKVSHSIDARVRGNCQQLTCAMCAPRCDSSLPCQSMQIHHDAKHPKLAWEPEKCVRASTVQFSSSV